MGPHAGVAGSEWLKDDLSLFPNNNISPLALPRHQNPRTISLGFQIIIRPLDPSPSALSRTIAQFANRYLPLESPHHTFQWVILLVLVMAMDIEFGLFSFFWDTQQTSHIRFHSLRTWLFILCRRSYFPNPTLFQRWISSKLFQVGKLCYFSICGGQGGQGVGGRACNLPSVMSKGRALRLCCYWCYY